MDFINGESIELKERVEVDLENEGALLDSVNGKLFIGGKWMPAKDGSTFEVEDPATATPIKSVANGSIEDMQIAIDAADQAFVSWSKQAPRVRGELLRKVFELVMERKDRIALLMTLEMGKPIRESLAEVTYGADFLRWFSEEAVRIHGRYYQAPDGASTIITMKQPVGPVYMITPWNFPLAMATRKIAPALAAGCTAIVKPASLTPLTTIYLAQIFEEAGLPPGVLNVITTKQSSKISEFAINDPRIRKISFTGSTEVGKRLVVSSATNLLRVSMELGGNAPFIVMDDADLDSAVEGAMMAKMRNMGEACTSVNRFLVHSNIAAEFTERLAVKFSKLRVGRGTESSTDVGPLIDSDAMSKVSGLVDSAKVAGATVVVGGSRLDGPGHFFAPTVISGVHPGALITKEEIFGPVASILTFEDTEEAVRLANDTEFGLVGYLYTKDLDRAVGVIESLQSGMVGVNQGLVSNAAAPFGGIKQSGYGREGGFEGIDEYLSVKYAAVHRIK